MIKEMAVLNILPGTAEEFEQSFAQAQSFISSMPGYLSHELLRCVEVENRYLLLVDWESVEAHEVGFRQSTQYQRWKALLHKYYDPFPEVHHFQPIL